MSIMKAEHRMMSAQSRTDDIDWLDAEAHSKGSSGRNEPEKLEALVIFVP
jgi:hypothetical protein